MLIIGHRGAAGLAPENTVSSLKKAEEIGVDMVEIDFRQTKDGEVIAMHDKLLSRTHDERKAVSDLTLKEIKEIGVREGREIPTLTEIISTVKVPLNLELKETGFEKKIVSALKNFSYDVLVSSSNPLVLQKIRALDEKINLGFIIGPKWEKFFFWAMSIAKRLDLYSIHPYKSVMTSKHVSQIKGLNKKVFVWTVNDKIDFETMKGFGVDGIFTDYPNLFK